MPFDAVAEALLKGGVAPRHVRRYVRELDEHLDDLTAQQRASGYDGEDAATRARARLGSDAELAQAMLDRPGMRSWPARLPWLVFLLLPPASVLLIGGPLYGGFYYVGNEAVKISAVLSVPQEWLLGVSVTAMTITSILIPPVIGVLLAVLAQRQRLNPLWPLLGIGLLLLATPMFGHKFGHHHDGNLNVGYGLVIPGRWSTVVRFWPLMLNHALTLLPAAWLILRRKRAA